ncbi:MAG: alpha-ketoglutarate-dependent dioxygenase AlkB [Vulcanimicrobiaceae bacterium]
MAVRRLRLRGAHEPTLFEAPTTSVPYDLADSDGDFVLYRAWLGRERADVLFATLRATTVWRAERRKMYDRFVDVPREQAWYGDDRELPFTPELATLRGELERLAATTFSYVLLNRYRDGSDSVAWHNDRETPGLPRPVIASLTLGATRAFDVRRKADRARVTSVDLDHGDLVIMRGTAQSHFEHRVAKDRRVRGERINLTFRQLPD